MTRKLNTFSNGAFIEFDAGKFDDWCVYLTPSNGERYAPGDILYFSRIKTLAKKYGNQRIYDDFIVIFNRTTCDINSGVLQLISVLSEF